MNTYKSIIKGLNEAIEYEKGTLKNVKKRKISIIPLPNFRDLDIKEIRNNLDLSQKNFAELMGVSLKTIEAWEAGKNIPSGPAQRMLELFNKNKTLAKEYVFIK